MSDKLSSRGGSVPTTTIPPARPMTLEIERSPGHTRVIVAGDFTEDSDFSRLLDERESVLTLDVAAVRRINSCGVREWINFVSTAEGSGCQLTLERCSVAFVQQLNMILNFRGQAKVVSLYAPYFCRKCDAEQSILVRLDEPGPHISATAPCPKCRETMEFDDVFEAYLSFRE